MLFARLRRTTVAPQRSVAARYAGALLAGAMIAMATAPLLASSAAAANPPDPSPPFSQCPVVGAAHGCGVLIVLEPDGSVHLLGDAGSGNPYDGNDDTTIGVLNESGADISNITLSSSTLDIMGFDGDGICSGGFSGTPAGCPFDSTGYAGPGVTYTNINSAATSGVVNFARSCSGNTAASCVSTPAGLQSGTSAFFSLEESVDAASFVIPKANPTISTTPSPSVTVGGSISDSAVLAAGRVPSGAITFRLYGPGDTTCQTAISTLTTPVSGNGTYNSTGVTATTPGTYRWTASYGGDANNNATGTTACGSESVLVTKASPTISTVPSGQVPVGSNISDTATLAGGFAPSGTVTFRLYGPGDTTCQTAISTLTAPVSGNGNYGSGSVATSAPGTYHWVVSYGGDANNNAFGPTACGSESVTVIKATPTISTIPSPSVPAGGKISDTAALAGGFAPSGTITFRLYGPGDTTCHTAISTLTAPVSGSGSYGSGTFTTSVAGTYNWVATYGGDANNNAVGPTACGSESVIVTPQIMTGRAFGLSANASTLGVSLLTINPTPDTGSIATPAAGTTAPPCVATISGLISANTLCAKVVTALLPSGSTATASINSTSIGIGALPVINVGAVQSQSATTCAQSSGNVTIASLSVGGVVVIAHPTTIAPNTTVSVLGVNLILNEQTPVPGGLTVNAVHVNVTGLVNADVVLASSTSDIHNCP